ncbi:MAG: FliH/SctL family protein [Acidimicrobiia bacterium]|nr:FliH/SctL family protein [Acidimicrobiia bacterium]
MSSSTDAVRGRVLRGDAAAEALAASFELAALATRPLGDGDIVVDPGLVEEAAEQGRRHGYEDGYAAGHAQGYADGRDAALAAVREEVERAERERDARMATALEALDRLARDFEGRVAATFETLEGRLSTAAFELTESLFRRELALGRSPGLDAVARALELAPARLPLVVRLSPADAETVGDPGALAPGRDLRLVADPELQPGDCVVDAGAMHIDATFGAALERVRRLLCEEDA